MSIARVNSFAFAGIAAQPVEVQVQIASGLPNFLMVGLPDKAVGEARERVRAALTAMGLALPPKRVLVNLAPADVLKEGSHFDLPVALAVLAAMDVLPREELAQFAALGELSLDGRINPVAGVLPAAIAAAGRDLGLICPEAQGPEASWLGGRRPERPCRTGSTLPDQPFPRHAALVLSAGRHARWRPQNPGPRRCARHGNRTARSRSRGGGRT
jgi:magnesium chelatase family protein